MTRARYQPDETSARIAALSLLGVLALIPLSALLVWAMFAAFHALNPASAPPPAPEVAHADAPRLEAVPGAERKALEANARKRLESAGPGHMPIERAMAMQAERGWRDAEATP